MENYNICWDMFKVSASEAFQNLLKDTDFTDVTLVCEDGKQMQAHKVILSACSQFFKDIFVQNPHTHPLLYLKGISYSQLRNLINFAYLGETEVAQESLDSFINAAKELKIEGLSTFGSEQDTREEVGKYEHCEISEEHTSRVDQQESLKNVDDVKTLEILISNPEIEDSELIRSSEGYNCHNCDYIAKYSNHLKRHQLSKHEGIKYPCSQCETKFTQVTSLKRHMINIHSKH